MFRLANVLHAAMGIIFLIANVYLVVHLVLFVQEQMNAQPVLDLTIITEGSANYAHSRVLNVQVLLFVQVALRQVTPFRLETA